MAISIKFNADGSMAAVAPLVFAKMRAKVIKRMGHQSWCFKEETGSYPGDGECECGMVKHHVHCSCGGIVQVG